MRHLPQRAPHDETRLRVFVCVCVRVAMRALHAYFQWIWRMLRNLIFSHGRRRGKKRATATRLCNPIYRYRDCLKNVPFGLVSELTLRHIQQRIWTFDGNDEIKKIEKRNTFRSSRSRTNGMENNSNHWFGLNSLHIYVECHHTFLLFVSLSRHVCVCAFSFVHSIPLLVG